MAEIKNPEHVLVEIQPKELLGNAMAMKHHGLRLSQPFLTEIHTLHEHIQGHLLFSAINQSLLRYHR